MDKPKLLKGYLLALIISAAYLMPVQVSADDIFKGFIPCTKNGSCANKAGDKTDDEVGRIGAEIPENHGDDIELVDVTPEEPPEPEPPVLEDDETELERDSGMCTVDQPLLGKVFIPAPPEQNTPYDCKIVGCRGPSLVEKHDDDDISDQDKVCSECKSGKKKFKPINSVCDDGLFCTSKDGVRPGPDNCVDGVCLGKGIQPNDLVGIGQDYDISELRRKLKGASNTLKKINSRCSINEPGFSGGIKMTFVDACCESRDKILRGSRFEGTVTYTVPPLQCDFPVGRPWGVIEIGATAGISIAGEVSGYGTALQGCDGYCDSGIKGSAKLTFKGGIYAALITPDVAKVEGTINAGGSLFFDKKCDEELKLLDWCIGPPRIEGRVVLGGWWGQAIDYEWEEKKICS